ncbi:hypothetical protein [Sulfurimonas sp. C5]|uniref:hypothetical protein n=1 Tax=Sulfurimonas sp. C5 TaxID=3036947 RepID=UPI002453BF05|nr:hypothetical protein [Sulfurimonas sp. C5]MDH4943526.1 hypothetical protein [Sulfurimonas sp. C5]
MLKKVNFGSTSFYDIHELFGLDEHEDLEQRSSRLFPLGKSESETSTTSIFLATMSAVKEYREELLSTIGIKKITNKNVQLHTYTELSNDDGDRPDGVIVITSGKNNPIVEWMCFVESKVGNQVLEQTQVDRYVKFARDIGITSIITISNQLETTPFDSPLQAPRGKFELFHWSWAYLKVMATRLIRTDSIEDEDHIYILNEFRRYCDTHPYLSHYENMGKEWKDAVNKIQDLSSDQKVDNALLNSIIDSYKQEEKDISLQLTDKTKHYIELVSKNDRVEEMIKSLNTNKTITSEYTINHDKSKTFYIRVNFHQQSVECFTNIQIDKGKAHAQTTALVKMLEDESGTTDLIAVTAYYPRNKCIEPAYLSKLIEEKDKALQYSIINKELGDTIKTFEIKTKDLLGRNFQGSKNFITNLEEYALRFVTQVMNNL